MSTSDASYIDFKLEFIHKKWSKLLLNWINRCVNERNRAKRARRLSFTCLSDIMTKYKEDVCDDEFEKAVVQDIEPFIVYKYPSLRIRYLTGEEDMPKKLYIMTSMLLYHCCMRSRSGIVHEDIYNQLTKEEQELILKYCERLNLLEITIRNVEVAIIEAFEYVLKQIMDKHVSETSSNALQERSSDTAAQISITSTEKTSWSTLPSDTTVVDNDNSASSIKRATPLKFASDITVMPYVVTDTSTFSDIQIASKDMVVDQGVSAGPIELHNMEQLKPKNEYKIEVDKFPKDKEEIDKDLKDQEGKRQNIENAIVPRYQVYENKYYDSEAPEKSEKQIVFLHKEEIRNKGKEMQLVEQQNPRCLLECSCTRCSAPGPCCGDPGTAPVSCDIKNRKPFRLNTSKLARLRINRKVTALVISIVLFFILVSILTTIMFFYNWKRKQTKPLVEVQRLVEERTFQQDTWECIHSLCQKAYRPTNEQVYTSHSRCILMCTGPQIWPLPIGDTKYSSKIIALATNKLEYKLETVSSDTLQRYSAEALKLFISNLAKLEKTGQNYKSKSLGLNVMKMYIHINVDTDHDPKIRLNTEESYKLIIETTNNQVLIKITSSSFCGVRHGLETLTQMILLDKSTGYLITISDAIIKDAPSYKYRGLMIDTGRNYIPVKDLMRTIDAMASVKLNTFHWRISDATSFPLFLANSPQFFEHGAYDRFMVYTKDDVKTIVKRAGVRGIRVLIEIAAPGPVGRAWSWSSSTYCPSMKNNTCDNVLCTILDPQGVVLKSLHGLYKEIIEMTEVNDVFHLSNGVFSLSNCFDLMKYRNGYLDKALDTLKQANKGFLPKLPIIWYTPHLTKDYESKTWERYGVQLNDWVPNPSEQFLSKFKVIHSSKWELSCEIKNQRCKRYRSWQEMYSWKSWRNLEAFTVEGGEATLWTDLVDSNNLDFHIWPRTAAVAERLWSDIVANATADGSVYVRLNSYRSRLLQVGVKAPAIWPAWCTYNPGPCLEKIQ